MNPNLTRKILIDTDTASDDAVALIMALRSPKVTRARDHRSRGECFGGAGDAERPVHRGTLWLRRSGILRSSGAR